MSDTDDVEYKQLEYIDQIQMKYEKTEYYSEIENASINLIENLREYLRQRGSILYDRVQRADFSTKIYTIIHEIIEKKIK